MARTPYNLYLINVQRKRKMFLKLEKIFCIVNFPMGRYVFKKYYFFVFTTFLPWFIWQPLGQVINRTVGVLRRKFLTATAVWKEFKCTYFTRNRQQRTLELVETYFPTPLLLHVFLRQEWLWSPDNFIHLMKPFSYTAPRFSIRGFCIFLLWELCWSLIVHRTTAMQTPRGQR